MLLIDLHTHTSYGSPCSYMNPDELVMRAKAVGLDGVCITEHDQLWSAEAIEKLRREHQFLVLGGVEVNTDCGHVLVFGLRGRIVETYYAEELRQAVDEAGGVMITAHPFRSYLSGANPDWDGPPSIEVCSRWPIFRYVDAVEVYNGMNSHGMREFSARVATYLGLGDTGGSDAHCITEVGICATAFENRIESEVDLIREIKGGRFRGVDRNSLPLKRGTIGSPGVFP